MAAAAPDLPDALVRLPPVGLQDIHDAALHLPDRFLVRQALPCRLVEQVEDLAVDVQLELPRRVVAHANGERVLVAGEPVELELGQAALAAEAVHDPQVARVAGHRAQQPLPPFLRFALVAGQQHAVERERRVPEPADPVVPVPRAADLLGDRRGRRGDDAAGRPVGQRLQRQERPHHGLAPFPLVRAGRAPLAPEARRGPQRVPRVDLRRRRLERPVPDQHEREPLPGANQEIGRHGSGGDLDRHVGPQLDRVGAGDRGDRAAPRPEPRDGEAVVEAEPQLRAHRDDAADPLDQPDHAGLAAARRHELGDADQAVVDRVIRLEDQRVLPVAPARASRRCRAAPAATGRARRCRGGPRSRRPSRTAAGTASRSSRSCRPGPPCACRR